MLKWELKKLCIRFTLVSLAVLTLVHLVVVFLPCREYAGERGQRIREAQTALIDLYNNDRAAYDESLARHTEQNASYEDWLWYGEGAFSWVNERIDLEDYGDRQLWQDVLPVIARAEEYPADIDRVLRESYGKLREMGNRRGAYAYEYQVHLLLRYEETAEIRFTPAPIFGWNEYFSLVSPAVLLLLALAVVSVPAFLGEKQARFTAILHVSRYGEDRTRLAKIGALFLASTGLTLFFTLSPLLILAFTTGLSDPTVPMQALDSFEFCPLRCTVLEGLGLYLLVRIAVCFVFSLLCAVIGQVSGSFVLSFMGIFAFLAVNALLPVGFFTPLFVRFFWERYRAVNLLGLHMSAGLFCGILLGTAAAALFWAAMKAKISTREYRLLGKCIRAMEKKKRRREQNRPVRDHAHGIFGWEMRKLLWNPRAMAILMLLFAVRWVVQDGYFTPLLTEEDVVYRTYLAEMAALGGRLDEATESYLAEEEAYLADAHREYGQSVTLYAEGTLSSEAFHEISGRKNYAERVAEGLAKLYRQRAHLKAMSDTYDNLGYVDEDGVQKLLVPDFDVVFALVLLVFLADILSGEQTAGFAAILRTTRHGRRSTLRAKYLSAMATVVIVQAVFLWGDLLLLRENYPMNGLSFSLLSLPAFSAVGWDIPVWTYIVLCKAAGLAGSLVLSVLAVGISCLASHTAGSVTILFAGLLGPWLLTVFGFSPAAHLHIRHLTAPVLPGDGIYLCLCLVPALAFTLQTTRKWEGIHGPAEKTGKERKGTT